MSSDLSDTDFACLAATPLFSGLKREEIERLTANSPVRRYKARTVLMEKGDAASALYVILEGRVRIFAQGEDDKEITLNELEDGGCFGELALITDEPRCASAITCSSARLLTIPKAQFRAFLASSPDAALRMIHHLANKVRVLTQDVERLALRDVYGRLVDTLNERSIEHDGERSVGPITQQELANLVGASREMISRIFKELKAGGYISLEGKRIILTRTLPARW